MAEELLFINNEISIPLSEFEFSHARSSGPGGQNVNKVNTKVTLRWPVTDTESLPEDVRGRFCKRYANRITTEGVFVLASQASRNQHRNYADCLNRLATMILEVVPPPKVRKRKRPTRGMIERRLKQKKQRSERKQNRRKIDWRD